MLKLQERNGTAGIKLRFERKKQRHISGNMPPVRMICTDAECPSKKRNHAGCIRHENALRDLGESAVIFAVKRRTINQSRTVGLVIQCSTQKHLAREVTDRRCNSLYFES